ncbi:MAG: hypothetical protein SPI86_04165 [Treponemataceae bacterium]|nr:hypothetical protein [Spirochaetales bacterium]MDY6030944.1 hypothetical protein [Treponemataceae bacterium]
MQRNYIDSSYQDDDNLKKIVTKEPLKKAEQYLRRRQFAKAITLLESVIYQFRNSFKFYYMLGLSYLYIDDLGSASDYFKCARDIKQRDANLLIAQAVIYLKRGMIKESISYCMEVIDLDPKNKIAFEMLDFIKVYGDVDTISEMNYSGKLKKFYPPLPKRRLYIPIVLGILCAFGIVFGVYKIIDYNKENARLSTQEYAITNGADVLDKSMNGVYRYILTQKEAEDYYSKALNYVNKFDDNNAQKVINLLLQSNCSSYIKQKASLIQNDVLVEPTFDSDFTNFTFAQVNEDLYLYENCWVLWSGRVTNIIRNDDVTVCDMLVGYEDFKKKDGDAKLRISSEIMLASDRPIKVLAKVGITSNGELILLGKSVYQPLGDRF